MEEQNLDITALEFHAGTIALSMAREAAAKAGWREDVDFIHVGDNLSARDVVANVHASSAPPASLDSHEARGFRACCRKSRLLCVDA